VKIAMENYRKSVDHLQFLAEHAATLSGPALSLAEGDQARRQRVTSCAESATMAVCCRD